MSISIVIVLFAVSTSETVNDASLYTKSVAINLTILFAATMPVPCTLIFETPSFNFPVWNCVNVTLVLVAGKCVAGITILLSLK